MMLAKLGYRNLWRNRRRTLLTMTAMTAATALLILTLSVYDGMMWDMVRSATENYHGHAKVTAPGYIDKRKMEMTLPQQGFREKLLADPEVLGVSGRTRGFALLSSGAGEKSQTQPAELLGVSPQEERTVTKLADSVTEGKFLSGRNAKELVIGKGLARRLNAKVGGEIVAMGQAADGSIAAEVFMLSGILDTGDSVRDASLALAERDTIQRMFVLPGEIHEWSIALRRPLAAPAWAAAMRMNIKDADVLPWQAVLPQVAQSLAMWESFDIVYAVIFYFAVVLIGFNTMSMAFFERIREFAVMGAIGLKPKKLARLILLEGFFMSSMAGIMGGILGALGSFLLWQYPIDLSGVLSGFSYAGTTIQPRIQTYLALDSILEPVAMMAILGVFVSLFPALRLRKLRPVEALRET